MKTPYLEDTIKNRIIHMLDDIEKAFKLYFDLQIDELTDIKGTTHALKFFCFINENQIANLFLCSRQLSELLQ